MDELLERLQNRLGQLRIRGDNIVTALRNSAAELSQTGAAPSLALIEELKGFRTAFRDFRNQLQTGCDGDESLSAKSISDLDAELASRAIVKSAIELLEQFQIVEATEPQAARLWQRCADDATDVRNALQKSSGRASRELAKRLLSAEHPLGAIIAFITQRDTLTDEQWWAIQLEISAAYGRELSTAIARGRLMAQSRSQSPDRK